MDDALREAFAELHRRRCVAAARPAAARRHMLRALRAAVQAERSSLLAAVTQDLGRPAVETELLELQPLLIEIDHAIRYLPSWMAGSRVPTPWVLVGTRAEVRYEPRGVALILSPWNYPINLTLAPLVAAVAAGNCVALKPSEKAPATAAALAQIVAQVFEPGDVACFRGGPEVAEALLALPFDHVFFTGDARKGRAVLRAAAEHLASTTLELGGKTPALVHEDADLDAAAERIAWGKFVNAGQTCVAPDYVLVDAARASAFEARLGAAVARLYGTAADTPGGAISRIVDAAAWTRLTILLEEAIRGGARIVHGGRTWPQERRMEPTVLVNVPAASPLLREEIFGPLLPIVPFDSVDAAVNRVRAGTAPLAVYVFTRSRRTFERVMRDTPAGAAVWNQVALQFGNPHLPFGGALGTYHGWFGFRNFSRERAVLRQGRFSLTRLFYPPYDVHTDRRVRWLRRLTGR